MVFQALDTKKSGTVGLPELQRAFKGLQIRLDPSGARLLLNRLAFPTPNFVLAYEEFSEGSND